MGLLLIVILTLQPLLSAASSTMQLQLDPPELVGASNNSATHYWFPTDMAVVFNESHFLLDARLADDCSDYFCNHTTPHKPSDPSHQVSLSTDGGRSFTPLYEVGGSSPWSAGLTDAPFIGPCTLALNSTARLSLYQGQISAPWESVAALFTLDPASGLSWSLADRPIRYSGVETVCGTGHMYAGPSLPSSQPRLCLTIILCVSLVCTQVESGRCCYGRRLAPQRSVRHEDAQWHHSDQRKQPADLHLC
jgi:hypothetical protein